jgi:hypothetical protein
LPHGEAAGDLAEAKAVASDGTTADSTKPQSDSALRSGSIAVVVKAV